MKVVALVPIKMNSQRLPHKNILPLKDKPLSWHICNTLLRVSNINETYVFCSNEGIKKYIPEEVIFKKRSESLDGDLVKAFDLYSAFINTIDADIYVVAHTTAPFIKAGTIEEALKAVLSGNYDSAFSAKKIQTFAWYRNEPINYDLNDVPRTQDMDPLFIETSGFFIFKKDVFTKHHRRIGYKPFIQEVSDIEAVDIDEKSDYDFACHIAGYLK